MTPVTFNYLLRPMQCLLTTNRRFNLETSNISRFGFSNDAED